MLPSPENLRIKLQINSFTNGSPLPPITNQFEVKVVLGLKSRPVQSLIRKRFFKTRPAANNNQTFNSSLDSSIPRNNNKHEFNKTLLGRLISQRPRKLEKISQKTLYKMNSKSTKRISAVASTLLTDSAVNNVGHGRSMSTLRQSSDSSEIQQELRENNNNNNENEQNNWKIEEKIPILLAKLQHILGPKRNEMNEVSKLRLKLRISAQNNSRIFQNEAIKTMKTGTKPIYGTRDLFNVERFTGMETANDSSFIGIHSSTSLNTLVRFSLEAKNKSLREKMENNAKK